MDEINLMIEPTSLRRSLVEFIRNELGKTGFSKGIVGLSGGVDSALVTYLAVEALGRDNVRAVLLPYRTSNPQNLSDSLVIVNNLQIKAETIDITPMVDAYLSIAKEVDDIRRGNVMARQRMIILYDISARENALVIGTSNKTETLLGYGTLFGDTACAINPIGDLYKTQVWQLAEAVGVPKNIIDKVPSADLWVGQTDEGELGFTYSSVDKLLYAIIDMKLNYEELLKIGFEMGFIEKVNQMIQRNKFKRQLPVVAKIF